MLVAGITLALVEAGGRRSRTCGGWLELESEEVQLTLLAELSLE
jgi:hypothetical protein